MAALALGVVFAITWLVLLVDCVRRSEFGGPFHRTGLDKGFWLVCFLLLDPLCSGSICCS